MRKLHVLHVIESLGHGGAEQNLLSILRRLPPTRYENHLAWLYGDHRLLEEFRPHVASLVPLDGDGRGGFFRAAARLTRWIRNERPDVVHAQLIRAELAARIAALAGRTPVVTTWQNVFYEEAALPDFGDSRARRAVVRTLDQLTGLRDRRFVAVSQHVAHRMMAHLGLDKSRVVVIPNAVEPDRYARVPEPELARIRFDLGVSEKTRLLLSVGRLVKQKGHEDAIRCMPAVLTKHDAMLLIAGAGPRYEELDALIGALGLNDRVKLLGARADVPALMQLCDLFVFPSRYEGLSVALVEALANGMPAVVSDIPPNREVAVDMTSVRFVPCDEPEAWSLAISESLVASHALRIASEDAREPLRRQYAPERLAMQLEAVFAAAAAPSGNAWFGAAESDMVPVPENDTLS